MKRFLSSPFGITLAIIVAAALAMAALTFLTRAPSLGDGKKVTVQVDKATVEATVAATEASRRQGLAGTQPLGEKNGMLFIFSESNLHPFWMKGVTYPIDIIWIENDTVSEVLPNVPPAAAGVPDEALPKYQPAFPVSKVLEVASGWAARNGIQPGDPVRISR